MAVLSSNGSSAAWTGGSCRWCAFFGRVVGAAVPDRYLPDRVELRGLVADLLGVPPSEVTAVEVDAAARVAAEYQGEKGNLPDHLPAQLRAELAKFARGELPRILMAADHPVRALGRLLQFVDELAVSAKYKDGLDRIGRPSLTVAAQVAALVRAAAGPDSQDRPLFWPDVEPVLKGLFGRRPVGELGWRQGALLFTVAWLLDGGDPAEPVSMDSLTEAAGVLLDGTLAPPHVVAGFQRVWRLGCARLHPGTRLTRRQWSDFTLLLARHPALDVPLQIAEFADFVHRLWGRTPARVERWHVS